MDRLHRLFEQFLRERTYIQNVTPATCEWYQSAWKAFKRAHANAPERPPTAPLITKADLQYFVVHERERGIRPVTCNTWLRALNAFCRWRHEQGELPTLVKLAPQRLEKTTHPHARPCRTAGTPDPTAKDVRALAYPRAGLDDSRHRLHSPLGRLAWELRQAPAKRRLAAAASSVIDSEHPAARANARWVRADLLA